MNAPDMSIEHSYASVNTVGALVSILSILPLCFLLSTHLWLFYLSAAHFLDTLNVGELYHFPIHTYRLVFFGFKTILSWSCFNSAVMTSTPGCPNFFIPLLMWYCAKTVVTRSLVIEFASSLKPI